MSKRSPSRPVWPYVAGVAVYAAATSWGIAGATFGQMDLPPWLPVVALLVEIAYRATGLNLFVMHDGRSRLVRLPRWLQDAVLRVRTPFARDTTVILNVGGALMPLAIAACAIIRHPPGLQPFLMATILIGGFADLVREASFRLAFRPLALSVPLIAVLVSWTLDPRQCLVLALSSGCIGILAGNDVMHLRDLQYLGAAEVFIGSEASFRAIFASQLLALALLG